jgi:DNA-binding MarR family transcriptional regulator
MARRRLAETGPLWPTDRVDRLASWTLIRAYLVRVPLFVRALQPAGLTPTQFGVLVQLDNEPGLSQGQLARRALMTPQSMGELLVSLERLGYVTRGERAGRGHAVPVSLTPAGAAALAEATPLAEAANTAEAFGLTEEELATLNGLLHKVVRHSRRPA